MKVAKNDKKKSKYKNQKIRDISNYSKASMFDTENDKIEIQEKNEQYKGEKKEDNKTESRFGNSFKDNKKDSSKTKKSDYGKEEINSERISNILDEIKNYGGDKK